MSSIPHARTWIAFLWLLSCFFLTETHANSPLQTQQVAQGRNRPLKNPRRNTQQKNNKKSRSSPSSIVYSQPSPKAPVLIFHPNTQKKAFQINIKKIIKNAPTLNPNVLRLSIKAFQKLQKTKLNLKPLVTIIDFSKASTEPRFWVIDLKQGEALLHGYISHGCRSGHNFPKKFSNRKNSFQSTLGVLLTTQAYWGQHGYAMRVIGLEKGFNHNVALRDIVFHASRHVNKEFIKKHGRLGRSLGCFAVNPSIIKPLIDTIQGGTLVFSYYPNPIWLSQSHFLN